MQQNIRNLKDPTPQLECLLRVWAAVVLVLSGVCEGTPNYSSSSSSASQAQQSKFGQLGWQVQNATCTASNSKFICDCHNLNQPMELPHLVGYVFEVEILNCKSLSIQSNALADTQGLHKVNFRNIGNLILNKHALAFSKYASSTPIIIEFDQVNFELIDSHAINGNIEEVTFIGGRIDQMNAFGFTTLRDRGFLLKMDRVWIKKLEPQAFKRFALEHLEITNCVFESNVPSKAFYELDVYDALYIRNNRFREVHSKAFTFRVVGKLSVLGNFFDSVDAEWLDGQVKVSLKISENYFGLTSPIAFKGFSVHRDYVASEPLVLFFTNNTVRFPTEPKPLEFNSRFSLIMKNLKYENVYPCQDVDLQEKPAIAKTPFFRSHSDSIYFMRAGQTSPPPSPPKNATNRDNQSFLVLSKIIDWDCQPKSHWLLYTIIAVVVVFLLILVAIVLWIYTAKKRKKRKLDVVMPEPRTYKETQIVYQIENAGLLKTDL